MKRNFFITASTILVVLSFSACSSSDSTDETPISQVIIEIPKTCVDGLVPSMMADADAYIELKTGDTIVKDETPTEIVTTSTIDGSIYICKISGSAHIVRNK